MTATDWKTLNVDDGSEYWVRFTADRLRWLDSELRRTERDGLSCDADAAHAVRDSFADIHDCADVVVVPDEVYGGLLQIARESAPLHIMWVDENVTNEEMDTQFVRLSSAHCDLLSLALQKTL